MDSKDSPDRSSPNTPPNHASVSHTDGAITNGNQNLELGSDTTRLNADNLQRSPLVDGVLQSDVSSEIIHPRRAVLIETRSVLTRCLLG